jgi:ubiquinone/menaquinone biosynthesis C-methylase UbiE
VTDAKSEYALGYAGEEEQRLIRQGVRLAPITEAFLREAGVRQGDRVLDVGSGLGDVSLSLAHLVTHRGEVVGLERDPRWIEVARRRVATLGIKHVRFVEGDVRSFQDSATFDAIVGRYVLMFIPNPLENIRRLAGMLSPGGVLAFQEPSWNGSLGLQKTLPLFTACATAARDALVRAGAATEMGPALYTLFQEAGLPTPRMRLDFQVEASSLLARWASDILSSVLRGLGEPAPPELGDLETLPGRLYEEVCAANHVHFSVALFGAWSQRY